MSIREYGGLQKCSNTTNVNNLDSLLINERPKESARAYREAAITTRTY